MEIEWTQPDGSKIQLRVFGDEFYGRTETLDGYTVVFDPATQSYQYANRSADGKELVTTKVSVGNGNPTALGLTKRLDVTPEARKAKAQARFEEWDAVTRNSQRWAEIKAERAAFDEAVKDAKAGDGPMPAPPSFTTIGEKIGLTLLIDFSDAVGTIPQAEIINYCNSDTYTGYSNNGSVKKYFQDNSNNLLTYTNTVTAYIRMAQPKSFYNDTTKDAGAQGRLLINNAIDILKALPNYATEILPTFDTLTVDTSNRVLACNVFFAGANSGVWSQGLWPHAWSLASTKELSAGGKKVSKYQITNLGTSLTLGTFCHENGHMLCGYPDLYDYQSDSVGGAGKFCLMGSGGHGTNPVLINAYLKRASGWTTTITELTGSSNLTGTLVSTVGHADYNKIYRYANPAAPTTEYFLFENRQKTGRDAGISASGIAIWHIDQLGSRDNQSLVPNTTHANYECSLIQADNLWHFQSNTNAGDTKDLYYLGNTAAAYTNIFNDTSAPDANWWSGASSGLYVSSISSAGASMTLQFGLPPNTISVLAPNGGEQIYFGSTQSIGWLSNTSGNVKIELFKAGSLHTVLSASEANDGSYSWLVSPGLPAGSDYTIKISSVATPSYADSSNAAFTLMPQPTLADALDTTGLTWTNSGNASWFAQFTTTHDGTDAAQSGSIGDSQSSFMETTVTGPGTLTFWWKVSSEANYDFLRFYLDGTEQAAIPKISGSVDWTSKSISIPSGIHPVKWGYTKDGSVVANSDAAWVDQVVYTSLATPEIAVEQPVGTDRVDGIASIDCGSIPVAGSSGPITFTVKNSGDADLTGLVLSIDGTHSADFTLGSLGATTLAPGASTTFSVTFTPGSGGARTAAIHLANNDADENPFDIALTGTGVTVGTLAINPAGNLTASGSLGGPFTPASLQYTLSNPGSTSINWTAAKTAAWVDLSATGGTLPSGANTTVTVSINPVTAASLPINNYSDTVTFTNTTNGNGDTTRDVYLTVNPIPATVTLGNLTQTYDGSPKSVSVTTNPPGLTHTVTYTYNGSPTVPTNAGTYAVVATITDPDYVGSDSKDLVIGKAAQSITFGPLDLVTDLDAPFALTATASSGLPVSYTSSLSGVATVDGNTVTVVGLGTTTITASQAGSANYQTAASVPQNLTVVRANPLALTSGPYKVLIGQSLALDGSASQPSYGQTISAFGWDLNNDGIFDDAIGATPSAISVAELTSTWGMTQGINEIQLKVTDSAAKTSIVTTTVEVVLSLTWDANHTGTNRTDGGGPWAGANQWWDGSTNVTWASGSSATFGNTGAGGAVTLAGPTAVNTLDFNVFTGTYTLGTAAQTITLTGGITKNSGAGIVTLISPLVLGAAQTWTNNSATALSVAGANTMDNGGHTLTIDGSGTTSFGPSTNNTLSISGAGGIIKNGDGLFVLGGGGTPSNSYGGATTIHSGGILINGNGLGTGNGNLTITGGVLEQYFGNSFSRALGSASGQVRITGGSSGFSGQGATNSSFAITGTSPLVWGSADFNPAEFILQSAFANTDGKGTFSSSINLSGTTRTIRSNQSFGNFVNGYGTFSGNITNGSGTAGLIKTGSGHHLFTGTNTYNGGTTVSQGGLTVATTSSLPEYATAGKVTVADGAMLAVRTGTSWTAANIDALRGAATWSTTSSALGFDTLNGAFTYASNVTGAHSISKFGNNALTLSGNNLYTGTTTLYGGTNNVSILVADSATALGNGGNLTFRGGTLRFTANGASLDLSARIKNSTSTILIDTNGQNVTISGAIDSSNTAGLTLSGAGSLRLSGTNSYTGTTTTVSAGSMLVAVGANALPGNITHVGTVVFQRDDATASVTNLWAALSRNASSTFVVDRATPGVANSWNFTQQLNMATGQAVNTGSTIHWTKGSNITSGTPTIHYSASNGLTCSDSQNALGYFVKLVPDGVNLRVNGISNTRARTWNLSGNSTGNEIYGAITQSNTFPIALTKTGTGTWTISGNNNGSATGYTGTTTVDEGKLVIAATGSLKAASAVTVNNLANLVVNGTVNGTVLVNSGATLGGSGTIGGNTTLANDSGLAFDLSSPAATHDPLNITSGRDFAFSGASILTITTSGGMAPGLYTLVTGGNNITGVAPAVVNLPPGWAASVSISGNSLLLNVSGPVDHFAISAISSPQTVGTPVTGITITAKDSADQTAASFTGTVTFGGTSGITGTSASFVNGVLTGVTITPLIIGTNLTFTVDDGAGHTGTATLTVISAYDDWADGVFTNPFLDTDPSSNPDGDVFTNLQEFAFGTDPTVSSSGSITYQPGGNVTNPGAPVAVNVAIGEGVDYRAIFARRKNHAALGLTYTVQFSAGLGVWIDSTITPTILTGENSAGDIEAVSVPYPLFIATQSGFKKPTFFRVGVSLN